MTVPGDAIIVPYDVKSKTGVQDADHLLVPYDRYVELWNQANPDKKIDAHPAPLPYALSGAAYSAVLEGEETLNLTGQMQINVLAEGYVSIPFGLRGGVLARADLDGKPARLKVVSAEPDDSSRLRRKGGKAGRGHGRNAAGAAGFRQGDPQAGVGSAAEAGARGRMARHHRIAAHGPGRDGHLPRAASRRPRSAWARPSTAAFMRPSGPTKPWRRPWGPAGPCNCSGVRKWRRARSIAA